MRFTVPSEFMYSMWTAPELARSPSSSPNAPTARSATPSRSRSPSGARDEPKKSPLVSCGPLAVEEFISAVLLTVPSGLRYSMWTVPASGYPRVALSAPAARSGTPSRSRSPTAASDDPNPSPIASTGPFSIEESISTVLFTVPVEVMRNRWTSPVTVLLLMPGCPVRVLKPDAPAAMSAAPSPSTSPTRATDEPSASASPSCGPLAVDALISAVFFTVPSELRYSRRTAPALEAPSSSPGTPTATSAVPSRSMSPSDATDRPKASARAPPELSRSAKDAIVPFHSGALAPRRTTCTAPASGAPASSPGAPAARSGAPSRSRSPIAARDEPNPSPPARDGPLAVDAFISTVRFTVPSELRCSTWTAPAPDPPSSSPCAPAARSGTPS